MNSVPVGEGRASWSRRALGGALLLCLPSLSFATPQEDRQGVEFFEKKIRPILVQRCYECHSAGAKKVKGGLRLDSRPGVRKGGKLGPSIVLGRADRSTLIRAVRYIDEDLRMPGKAQIRAHEYAPLAIEVRSQHLAEWRGPNAGGP